MIEIKDLHKSYGSVEVLKGINMNISKKSKYGFIGRSGTGKSTLLKCINGIESYNSGSLKVDNIEVKDLNKKELIEVRKNIGMIFQNFSLLSRLNVYENIALPLKCWKYNNNYIDKKVKELLEMVEIPEKISSRPQELSGGQKQRVAIARSLTLNPDILLCDEATSALDPKTAEIIMELTNQVVQEKKVTTIMVTHNLRYAVEYGSRLVMMHEGNVILDKSGEEKKQVKMEEIMDIFNKISVECGN